MLAAAHNTAPFTRHHLYKVIVRFARFDPVKTADLRDYPGIQRGKTHYALSAFLRKPDFKTNRAQIVIFSGMHPIPDTEISRF